MKNKMPDLNNHLFAQLERVSEEGLDEEKIEIEIARSEAIVKISDQIVKGASLQLKAVQLVAKHGDRHIANLPMLEGKSQ